MQHRVGGDRRLRLAKGVTVEDAETKAGAELDEREDQRQAEDAVKHEGLQPGAALRGTFVHGRPSIST